MYRCVVMLIVCFPYLPDTGVLWIFEEESKVCASLVPDLFSQVHVVLVFAVVYSALFFTLGGLVLVECFGLKEAAEEGWSHVQLSRDLKSEFRDEDDEEEPFLSHL